MQLKLTGQITRESVANTIVEILDAIHSEPDYLTLMIDSEGGSLYDALHLYDFMKTVGFPIETIACGQVKSCAILPYLAGNRRLCYPNTTFMVHNLYTTLEGPIHVLEGKVQHAKAINDRQIKIIKEESGTDFENEMKVDWFITPEGAVKHGVSHGIIGRPEIKAPDQEWSDG